jgi:hypothetical protein
VISGLLRVTGVIALLALALPLGGVEAVRASRAQGAPVAAGRDAPAPAGAPERL